MSISPPVARTFRETFCAQYGVPSEFYGAAVLRLTLYPHARWLAELTPREFLAPDRLFIAAVGGLTRWRSFGGEVQDFQHTPENRRFARRRLRFRVSIDRMRVLFSEVMGGANTAGRSKSRLRAAARRGPGSLAVD